MTDEDQVLAARIRSLLKRREGYSEKKMFGGIGFFIDGNMCVGPWKGSLIVRLDKACHEQTQAEPHVGPMDITGKVMRGWARTCRHRRRRRAQSVGRPRGALRPHLAREDYASPSCVTQNYASQE